MAIFRECKHSFQIVQALFGKSASTLVFFASQPFSFPIARLRRSTLRLSESNGKRAFRLPSVSRVAATAANLRISPESLRTLFASAKVIHSADRNGTSCATTTS